MMHRAAAAILAIATLAGLAVLGACRSRGKTFEDAPVRAAGAKRGRFALTYYWVSAEADQEPAVPRTATIYDKTCAPIARVSAAFARELATSGTGKLVDDRMITVAGECACKRSPCFRVVDAAWGIGADGRPLVPLRSVAVDRDVIPIGTALWIEELDGIELDLPNAFPMLHDGCVVADDIGGRIDGERVDWFVARKPYYVELDAAHHFKDVTIFDGGARCDSR